MLHAELPYVAFFAAVLVLLTVPWHWRARNIATLSIVAWLFVTNVIYGVDAVIWHRSIRITAVVWCDITTRIIIGASMALPAACMCISIHLAQVASASHVRNTQADKRRRQLLELLLCLGVPMLWMGLHYVVQGHRFDILEDYGCRPNTYVSIPSIFLIWVPPLIYSAVTVVYSSIALTHFLRHRITFARVLENSNSGLSTSRYLRLMAMAFAEIIITVVSTCITLWYTTLGLRPWTNFADVHFNFSRIDTYATVFMPPTVIHYYYVIWWIIPFSSIVFFVFFAFGQDAIKEYTACISWLRAHVFCCCARRPDAAAAASKGAKGYLGGPFVALRSTSFISSDCAMHSLPSYQTAIADGTGIPATDAYGFKEHYRAEPIDLQPVDFLHSHRMSTHADSDRLSYCTTAPPSPSHTESVASATRSSNTFSVDITPPALVHPHDLV